MKIHDESFAQVFARAEALASKGERTILGLTGAPGAGKSTLAERLVNELGPARAVLAPMDGFHFANVVLDSLGRRDCKGAADTFDAGGYVSLLRRIRHQHTDTSPHEPVIYAPEFRRDLEEPIGSALPVSADVPLVVTEGNYLLHSQGLWAHVRPLLDQVWFLAPTEEQRIAWLIERHMRFGRTEEEARERSLGSDQRNAEVISSFAERADLILRITAE